MKYPAGIEPTTSCCRDPEHSHLYHSARASEVTIPRIPELFELTSEEQTLHNVALEY